MTGFGKRLKQARQGLVLTGSELAAKLGVERTSIPQYENGHSFPSIPVLMKLARVLGVTVDWLLFDEYEMAGQIEDKELAVHFSLADKLQHRNRSLVIEFVQSLAAREKLEQIERKQRQAA